MSVGRAGDLHPEHAQRLVDAIVSSDPTEWRHAAESLLADGLPAVDLVDLYIPEIARRLGADWSEDRTGFAQVTIGCARLGQLVKWAEMRIPEIQIAAPLDHGQICLVCASGGQHNLGLMVLASQLRRRGVFVATVADGDLLPMADVVMISASGQEDLETLRKTVQRARDLKTNPRVILGGSAVMLDPDRCAAAGADTVTLDLDFAVTLCLRPPSDATTMAGSGS